MNHLKSGFVLLQVKVLMQQNIAPTFTFLVMLLVLSKKWFSAKERFQILYIERPRVDCA